MKINSLQYFELICKKHDFRTQELNLIILPYGIASLSSLPAAAIVVVVAVVVAILLRYNIALF